MNIDLSKLVRENIQKLAPYSCARNEFDGEAKVLLDANENPFNSPYNRYPDPLQRELKSKISKIKGVPVDNIFLGNGSDEAIDLCFRVFCNPGKDNVVAIEPTYGMYRVAADINDVKYRPVLLDENFSLNADKLLQSTDARTKLIFICSPNNPSGNSLSPEEIKKVLDGFNGIVVIDEAYSDFAKQPQFRNKLSEYPNAIVLNTFSKAWGCAGIRLGMAFASKEIISYFNKVKYPYNINILTLQEADKMLSGRYEVDKWVSIILEERVCLTNAVSILPYCEKVYPTDSNFFLAKFDDATKLYNYLVNCGVIVRNRSSVKLCGNCLRITVGSQSENSLLLSAMRKYKH